MIINNHDMIRLKSATVSRGILDIKFFHPRGKQGDFTYIKCLIIEKGEPIYKKYFLSEFESFNELAKWVIRSAEEAGSLRELREWTEKNIPEEQWDDMNTDDVARIATSMMKA